MDKGYCILENALSPEETQSLLVKTEEVLSLDDNSDDFLRINKYKNIHKIKYMFDKYERFIKFLLQK
jgi:hypothetical protein